MTSMASTILGGTAAIGAIRLIGTTPIGMAAIPGMAGGGGMAIMAHGIIIGDGMAIMTHGIGDGTTTPTTPCIMAADMVGITIIMAATVVEVVADNGLTPARRDIATSALHARAVPGAAGATHMSPRKVMAMFSVGGAVPPRQRPRPLQAAHPHVPIPPTVRVQGLEGHVLHRAVRHSPVHHVPQTPLIHHLHHIARQVHRVAPATHRAVVVVAEVPSEADIRVAVAVAAVAAAQAVAAVAAPSVDIDNLSSYPFSTTI